MRVRKLRRLIAWFFRDRSINYQWSYRDPDLHHDHVGWSEEPVDRHGPAHNVQDQGERRIQRRRRGMDP